MADYSSRIKLTKPSVPKEDKEAQDDAMTKRHQQKIIKRKIRLLEERYKNIKLAKSEQSEHLKEDLGQKDIKDIQSTQSTKEEHLKSINIQSNPNKTQEINKTQETIQGIQATQSNAKLQETPLGLDPPFSSTLTSSTPPPLPPLSSPHLSDEELIELEFADEILLLQQAAQEEESKLREKLREENFNAKAQLYRHASPFLSSSALDSSHLDSKIIDTSDLDPPLGLNPPIRHKTPEEMAEIKTQIKEKLRERVERAIKQQDKPPLEPLPPASTAVSIPKFTPMPPAPPLAVNKVPLAQSSISTAASSLSHLEQASPQPPSKSPVPPSPPAPPELMHELDKPAPAATHVVEKYLPPTSYLLPSTDFLSDPKEFRENIEIDSEIDEEIDEKVYNLLHKLKVFKVDGDIAATYSGPVVTTFEFKPAMNVKVSKILTLQDDLAMALKARSIRIQAPIPGKDVVGIEIPNNNIETIYLREIFESEVFKHSPPLSLALGKDISGEPYVIDLVRLPHLLIAGTTGSGKSVGLNAMILSLLFKNSPDDLRLIMIDPKQLEFSVYEDIPHLLAPIITDARKAINALSRAAQEMNRRYTLMSELKIVKNIEGYNDLARRDGLNPLPYIVIIIDEFADLMMTGGKDAEMPITLLAQKGRASGIHLIIATQRPSVDVITGLIKANLPSRISFLVSQKIDSKVILDSFGAESLLGNGDMLFSSKEGLIRLHAPFNQEQEIHRVVEFIKSQRAANYDPSFSFDEEVEESLKEEQPDDEQSMLIRQAKETILQDRKTSISHIQRRLNIGFNKAANIIEALEEERFLSPPNSKNIREILKGS